MIEEVKVPTVGESISEGVLAAWSVPDGGYVEKGATLFELETDKASTEVPAPESGTVKHLVEAGSDVEVGGVVAKIDTEGQKESGRPVEPDKKKAEPEKKEDSGKKSQDAAPAGYGRKEPSAESGNGGKPEERKEEKERAVAVDEEPQKPKATSVARKMAEAHGIDVGQIEGSGPGGRVTRQDVEGAVGRERGDESPRQQQAAEPEVAGAPAAVGSATRQTRRPGADGADVHRERMSLLRRKIAERLVQAQQQTAMLTTFNDVDMSAVMNLRREFKDRFQERHGVGLGFMSFFVKASVEALRDYPRVNAFVDGQEIVTHRRHHIGVAVSTEKGLVVPVLRDAGEMSFAEIEEAILDFATRARAGKIEVDELQGGTFTITNGGVFGSLLSTPILNPPQSGILGMHRIEDRPVARNGEVVIRPMMYVALSYDHRIVDGREAVRFLVRVKECLENPPRMLLDI